MNTRCNLHQIIPSKSRRSHPAQPVEGFDAPPTLERSGSEHRVGRLHPLVPEGFCPPELGEPKGRKDY